MAYCSNCGQSVDDKAVICVTCGVALHPVCGSYDPTSKDWLMTLLLCLFLGVFGVHRFYTGHTLIGVLQLLTGGGCGIWALIDFVLIAADSYKDSNGNPLVKN